MTSADEFVLQLLTDKGLLEESTIETARAKVNESEHDGSEDTDNDDAHPDNNKIGQFALVSCLSVCTECI